MDEGATHAQLEAAVRAWLDLQALVHDGAVAEEVRAELVTLTRALNAALDDVADSGRRLAAVCVQMEALAVKVREAQARGAG